MINLKQCPVCNNIKFKKWLTCTDHSVSKEKFNIVSCETCGFLFTNPKPKDGDINKYYISSNYISHTNKKKGLLNLLYQLVRKKTINKKLKLLKKFKENGVHLDIGCGTGEFLYACKINNYKTLGIEPSHLASKKAVKNYNLKISDDVTLSSIKDDSIDSISMWHVLEHIDNINNFIVQLNRILKNNGIIFIAVPNTESWDCKYYGKYWAAWDVPIHFWHFSSKTITTLLEKNGFKIIQEKPMWYDAFYISILSEEYKKGRKNYFISFLIGMISNLFAIFNKNNTSSLTYVVKKKGKNCCSN
mgnify:FL=1|tara:strand:+ start:1011 stop:1916 length:906 start_codon:yes stop_codon:yes gene_type:complete